MDSQDFEGYLTKIKKLSAQSYQDANALDKLLSLIRDYAARSSDNSSLAEFFKGEHDFYTKQYKQALKHYLEARSVEHFEFYCYRASAYISKIQGLLDKAMAFAKKALMIDPEDYPTLKLIEVLEQTSQTENEQQPRISLGEQELEELAGIFQTGSAQEALFHAEPSRPQNLESTMNTDASLFSFPKSQDPAMTAALTQRLYPIAQENSPFMAASNPVEEIKKQLTEGQEPESSFHFSTRPWTDSKELEDRIAFFQQTREERMISYREQIKHRRTLPDHFLHVLAGSRMGENSAWSSIISQEFQIDEGYFLRWNKKGIAINPGTGFLHNFHRLGLHIKDIDFVIVTHDNPAAYVDVQEIYELNYQLNRSHPQDLQIIHYYLNPSAYQDLSKKLKPHFKQERHTIHSMELFPDSPEEEKLDLNHGISLCYFPASALEVLAQTHNSSSERSHKLPLALGIRLELKLPEEKRSVYVGYLSGASWSPLVGHHLKQCDVLIAGFGSTYPNDYDKISYAEGCLGYFGCYSLIEELTPSLTLCTEFSGREGDICLEIIKKLRHDLSQKLLQHQNILPGDSGLFLDLKQLKVRCSISELFIDPSQVRVARSSTAFSPLHYLAPSCYL